MIFKKLIIAGLFAVMILPATIHAQTISEDEYRTYLLTLIELLQKQVALLQQERSDVKEKVFLSETLDEKDFESFLIKDFEDIQAWYLLSSPRQLDQIADKTHRQYFSRFFELVPDEYDDYFIDFIVFDEAKNEFDGFVETVAPYRDDTWRLGVSDSMFEFTSTSDFVEELFIHEFAHIISYEGIKGRAAPSNTRCHEFFSNFGCPPANSYIIDFLNEFWSEDDLDELVDAAEGESIWTNRELRNKFVTDYASTNPTEDFAESFTFFVLEDRVKGSGEIADKINYFYDFDDLIKLRNEIRSEL